MTEARRRRILVVDDEPHILELLAMHLKQNGFESILASEAETALRAAKAGGVDLILLDLMLPGIGGLEACRMLRADQSTAGIPIIMLTAKSEESDKVIGLGIGADDYVTKPFGLRELLARIEVALRHAAQRAPSAGITGSASGLRLDHAGRSASLSGERLGLTPAEFGILAALSDAAGAPVDRERLTEAVNAAGGSSEGRALDVHIRNLRRKLDPNPRGESYIKTLRSLGYRLET